MTSLRKHWGVLDDGEQERIPTNRASLLSIAIHTPHARLGTKRAEAGPLGAEYVDIETVYNGRPRWDTRTEPKGVYR